MNIDYSVLPQHMQEGMKRYVESGIEPGSFLEAVLKNDLMRAVIKADITNLSRLHDYCLFLYNELPPACYGSEENYNNWINK